MGPKVAAECFRLLLVQPRRRATSARAGALPKRPTSRPTTATSAAPTVPLSRQATKEAVPVPVELDAPARQVRWKHRAAKLWSLRRCSSNVPSPTVPKSTDISTDSSTISRTLTRRAEATEVEATVETTISTRIPIRKCRSRRRRMSLKWLRSPAKFPCRLAPMLQSFQQPDCLRR